MRHFTLCEFLLPKFCRTSRPLNARRKCCDIQARCVCHTSYLRHCASKVQLRRRKSARRMLHPQSVLREGLYSA